MHYDEIISQFTEKDDKVLYIGTPTDAIEKSATLSVFQSIDPLTTTVDLDNLSKDFDTVVFAEVLELVDDPRGIINQFKWQSKSSIVYEFKYDHIDGIDSAWKQPWKNIGLENILTWEFDYVRSLYLGYATVYYCEGPNKYTPDEIGQGVSVEQENKV
jgi:hypothetical protein